MKPTPKAAAVAAMHYNPDWLTDADLIAGFVARQSLLEYFLDALRRSPVQGNVNHYLLIGVRGAGKTTLLKRLAVAIRTDAALADHLIAVSFPEELYQVKDLADFWWTACEALADALDRLGLRAESERVMDAIERRPVSSGEVAGTDDRGLRCLLETCQRQGRRAVLLVDNLDLVMRRIDKRGRKVNDANAPAYWALREALSRPDAPMVIGGSVRLSEPFIGHDKAFYDFFLPKRLAKLSFAEVQEVLMRLAENHGDAALAERMRVQPGRIHALHDLTGGNPRALGLLFELIRQGPNARAVDDFERLLDLTTPYYKARFEELPEQTQVVLHALATARRAEDTDDDDATPYNGLTAATIARKAGLETKIVSAQLDVLLDEGVVEKEGGSKGQGRTHYRIAEQLFRIWIQMRTTRRMRLQITGLARFLEVLFDHDALEAAASDAEPGAAPTKGGAKFALAMSEVSRDAEQRRAWERRAADAVVHLDEGDAVDVRAVFHAGDLSPDLEVLTSRRASLKRASAAIRRTGERVLGAIRWTSAQKAELVDRMLAAETSDVACDEAETGLDEERKHLRQGSIDDAMLDAIYRHRLRGALRLPGLTPEEVEAEACHPDSGDIRAVAWSLLRAGQVRFADDASTVKWLDWARAHKADAPANEWAGLCRAFRRAGRTEAAEVALEESFERGESARGWYARGVLLHDKGGKFDDVANAYHKAIDLDPKDAWPWNALGDLLAKDPERDAEAEDAFRRAIELDSLFPLPWANLAGHLAKHRDRAADAETASMRAIELDPLHAYSWFVLGCLLQQGDRGRGAEAEAAYRQAIELNSLNASPWNNLGVLYANHLGRLEEAEAAFRRAIELDPRQSLSLRNLGVHLMQFDERLDEAETHLARSLELAPTDVLTVSLLVEIRARRALNPITAALEAGDNAALERAVRDNYADLAADPETLVSAAFVEGVVGRALHAGRGPSLLQALRSAGYTHVAQPLVVALDAALGGATAKLGRQDPEVRSAAIRLFERLIAAGDARTH